MILGNKIDKVGAASEDELRRIFGLFGQTTGKVSSFSFKRRVSELELKARTLKSQFCVLAYLSSRQYLIYITILSALILIFVF